MIRRSTRRTFLWQAAGGVVVGCAGIRLAAAEEPLAGGVKTAPDVVIYRGGYPGWPWVARSAKGRLACVFRDDSVHDFSPGGKVMWTTSDDAGQTWSPARTIADQPEVDDRNAAVVELPDGRWLVCYNTYTRQRVSQVMVTASSDDGATWSVPSPVVELDARTRSAPVVLASGRLLLPFYRSPGNGALAGLSDDAGRTWRVVPVPDGPGFLGDEWSCAEVSPGRVVGILRNSGASDGAFWKTESRDAGQTWDRPVRTNVRDARSTSPAHLDLHAGVPVLTYADRRMVSVSMVGTHDPQYVEWDLAERVECYRYRPDGQAIADGSYPVGAAVGPRRRLIVDYEIREDVHQIAGYFVDLPAGWV